MQFSTNEMKISNPKLFIAIFVNSNSEKSLFSIIFIFNHPVQCYLRLAPQCTIAVVMCTILTIKSITHL